MGQTESQSNVSGLGFMNNECNQMKTRRSSLGTKAAEVLRRFEIMKTDISEWKTSDDFQFATICSIIDHASMFTGISQDLAREAIMNGVNICVCGRIADYKTEIAKIKERMIKKIESRNNLTSSPTSFSGRIYPLIKIK